MKVKVREEGQMSPQPTLPSPLPLLPWYNKEKEAPRLHYNQGTAERKWSAWNEETKGGEQESIDPRGSQCLGYRTRGASTQS